MSDISEFLRKCADEAGELHDCFDANLSVMAYLDWDDLNNAFTRLIKLRDLLRAKAAESESQEAGSAMTTSRGLAGNLFDAALAKYGEAINKAWKAAKNSFEAKETINDIRLEIVREYGPEVAEAVKDKIAAFEVANDAYKAASDVYSAVASVWQVIEEALEDAGKACDTASEGSEKACLAVYEAADEAAGLP
jgi:hypothetical protein